MEKLGGGITLRVGDCHWRSLEMELGACPQRRRKEATVERRGERRKEKEEEGGARRRKVLERWQPTLARGREEQSKEENPFDLNAGSAKEIQLLHSFLFLLWNILHVLSKLNLPNPTIELALKFVGMERVFRS